MNTGTNNNRGFTLVEALISLVVVSIVIGGIYTFYLQMQKAKISQEVKAVLHQESRNVMDILSRDLMMAGYQGEIKAASSTSVEFTTNMHGTGTKWIKFNYNFGDKTFTRAEKADGAATYPDAVTIATNVTAAAFGYFSGPGPGDTTADLTEIRRVTVMVTMKSAKPDPTTKDYVYTTLRISIVPRNLAEGEGPVDSIAPSTPAAFRVIDNRDCSSLQLQWTANTEPDIAGYYISYGTTPGNYSNVFNLPINSMGFDKAAPTYKLAGLVSTHYVNRSSSVKYYITIQAYDNSMNFSTKFPEVSGPSDLATDVTSFGASGNDTVLNPAKPAPPANLNAYNPGNNPTGLPCGENQIRLQWPAATEATVGFRLYRSDTPFSSWPIASSSMIADELGTTGTTLGPNTTTYLDTVPVSCKDYYYAICSVNCDMSLIYGDAGSPAQYNTSGDFTLTDGDSVEAGIQGTQSDDSAGPPDPALAGSRGGWKRVFINLDNPALATTPDFERTMLYFSDQAMPSFDINGNVVGLGSQLVWDSGTTPYERGEFTDQGLSVNNSFVFNSATEDLGNYDAPQLINDHTYYFFAVAYDKCGNKSSGSTTAQTLATLCGDDPVGAPPTPSSVTPDGADIITVNWAWPATSYETWLDLQGYFVFRNTSNNFSGGTDKDTGAPAGTTPLMSTPLWGTTITDPSVQDGGTYYYCVRAVDCRWANITETDPDTGLPITDYWTIKANNITPCAPSSIVGPVNPGRIQRFSSPITNDQPLDPPATDTYNFVTSLGLNPADWSTNWYFNAVKFYIQNTSAGNIRLNKIKLSWGNNAAYLKAIRVGGLPGTSVTDDYVFSSPVSSSDASSGKDLTTLLSDASAKATGIGIPSYAIPVVLVFTNVDGSITDTADMRGQSIQVELQYENTTTGKLDCKSYFDNSHLNPINVPVGPTIYDSTISVPQWGTPAFDIPGSVEPPHSVLNDHPVALGGRDVWVWSYVTNTEQFTHTDPITGFTSTRFISAKDGNVHYATTNQGATGPGAATFNLLPVADNWYWDSYVQGRITPKDGNRVWYYFTYTSRSGNMDRLPRAANGEFMYDQGNFDVCDHTPVAPTNLTYELSGGKATLNWWGSWEYADGNWIDTSVDPIKYDVYRKILGDPLHPDWEKIASNIDSTTYADSLVLTGTTFYKVQAANSCAVPGPNLSEFSNEVAICLGGTSCTMVVGQTSVTLTSNWSVGGWFSSGWVNLDVYICSLTGDDKTWAKGSPESTIQVTVNTAQSVEASTLTLHEIDDTGHFTLSGTAYGANSVVITADPTMYNTSHTDSIQGATKKTALSDTVTFTLPAIGGCGVQTATLAVSTDPCGTAPAAPAISSSSRSGNNVTLNWSAVTTNSDGSGPITDLAGYKVYYANTDGTSPASTTVAPTETTVKINAGNGSHIFLIKAYDDCNLESAPSNQVTR